MFKHQHFLSYVAKYVEQHPDAAPFVTEFVAQGLSVALSEARQRAADMEVVAATLAGKRYPKQSEALVKAKLSEWEGRTSLRWDWLTKPSEK